MMKKIALFLLLALACVSVKAQRFTDKLDRGLVAVVPKNGSGIFLSWRIQADEYYDVKYNVYCNGAKLNTEPLNVSNFSHPGADDSGSYTVKAVVKGVEQSACPSVSVCTTNYKEITPKHDRSLRATYEPNDACCADVDGDGELEILLKYTNVQEASNYWLKEGYFGEYSLFECLKQDGRVLWWVNCGPNMGDFQNNEQNIIGYDWDKDGKAEVVMRLAEGSVIHKADGGTYTIGANGQNGGSWTNYRSGADVSAAGTTSAFTVYFGSTRPSNVSCNATWCTWEIQGNNVVVKSVADNGAASLTKGVSGRTATFTIDGRTCSFYQAGTSSNTGRDAAMSWFTHYGNEFLVYVNGQTGNPYQCIEFPLKRLEQGENNLSTAWGDGYGHRSSKYFFGAPCLDGKNASLFLARGIYTRHKMIAYDIKSDHSLSVRWTWTNNQKGSPWYGQGYHNYCIADVDMDGRDEIVFGSMVIDDNGKGLSTTGLGHGDAQHVSDFNPYVHGLEGFFCNEDQPGNNLRDMTTSNIYYRLEAGNDDGRAIMGNFSNVYPGAQGSSSRDGSNAISAVANNHLPVGTTGMAQNFRIYWDGDLCEETFNGTNGANSAGGIYKFGKSAPIETFDGSLVNNDTKATPCYQGDVFGDWREEVIMRTADNKIRIYTTTTPTEHRNYSLWYDHQYRNAMVWQMCGYNQPPHTSYYLGEMEGITIAPPPLTTRDRQIVGNSGSISASHNGKHVLVNETSNATVSVSSGAQPDIVTFNVPTWVQGSAASECTTKETAINTTVYQLTVTGSAFSGDTRIVKQGDGVLFLPNVEQTNAGPTDIWEGKVDFHNSFTNSDVWMNRHTVLTAGNATGAYMKSLTMEYGSTLYPSIVADGTSTSIAKLSVGDFTIKEGACVEFDFSTNASNCDQLNITNLKVVTKDWQFGPEYNAPVFRFKNATSLANGKYKIGSVSGLVSGKASDIIVEGVTTAVNNSPVSIHVYDEVLYLVVGPAEEETNSDPEIAENVAYKLDFEESSSNNYGFTQNANISFVQDNLGTTGKHYFHLYNDGNSNRSTGLSINGNSYVDGADYKLEFDMAIVSQGNNLSNESSINFKSGETQLFGIKFYGYANTYGVYASDGTSKLLDIECQAYLKYNSNNANYQPTKWSHYIVEGSATEGVFITIQNGAGVLVDRVKISNSYVMMDNIAISMSKCFSHIAFDDIILTQYSATLSDKKFMPAAVTYAEVKMDRTLFQGFNTFCIPFDSNPRELAENAIAYELTKVTQTGNGAYNLHFCATDRIDANKPYLLYVPNDVPVTSKFTNITLQSAVPYAQNVDGWQFVGNYTPNFNTSGKYLLADSNTFKHGGSSSYVNGMRAYLVAPTNSSNIRFVSATFDDADYIRTIEVETEEKIYSVNGVLLTSPQQGINIIKKSNGDVIKVLVK